MVVDDDAAFCGLAKHFGQAGDRDRAGIDDVGEDLARPDRGQLVDVADQQKGGSWRDRLHDGEHQRDIHHARLVDDEQVAFQRILRITPEAAVDGIDLEQAMDGLRLDAGLLGHALGRASGRRAEQDFDALGGEDAQNGVKQRRLADAGTAGDDGDLGAERHLKCGALRGGEHLARPLLDPGNGLVGVDRRPGRGALSQREEPVGDAPFGEIEAAQKNAGFRADRIGDDLIMGELMIQRRSYDRLVDFEEFGRELDEGLDRKSAMALVGRLLQRERDPGPNALRRLLRHAHLHGDRVSRPKSDAFYVAGKPIGILGHHLNGVMAIGLEDAHRPRRADAVGVQEDHDVAHGFLLGPTRGDFPGAELADAGNLPQFSGAASMISNVASPKAPTILLASVGTDAAHHAGAEVFLDALGRGRRGRLQRIGLELQAMRAIGEPDADGMDEFAGRDESGMADDGDKIAPPARLHLQDGETIFLVVKRHPLDGADERFTGGSGGGGGLQETMPLLVVDWRMTSNAASKRLATPRLRHRRPPWRGHE